jgi:ribosomal 50S subunit-associated protein YjgA (DUF615 family)
MPYSSREKKSSKKIGMENLRRKTRFMSKIIERECPETISNLFEKCKNGNYNLRSNGKLLRLSKPNSNAMKRSFSYNAAKVWNQQINCDNMFN